MFCVLCIVRLFHSGLWKTFSWPCVSFEVFHLHLSGGSFPSLDGFLIWMHLPSSQMKAWGQGLGGLWRSLQFSLSVASPLQSSLWFDPSELLWAPHSVFSTKGNFWAFLGFPFPELQLSKALYAVSWAIHKYTSFFILSQGSLSFAVSCPVSENCYFLYISPQIFSCLSN